MVPKWGHMQIPDTSYPRTSSTQVKVSLPPRLYCRVQQQAEEMGVSVAAYIRFVVLRHTEIISTLQKGGDQGQLNDNFSWLEDSQRSKQYSTCQK
jgi:hypothetical protein